MITVVFSTFKSTFLIKFIFVNICVFKCLLSDIYYVYLSSRYFELYINCAAKKSSFVFVRIVHFL